MAFQVFELLGIVGIVIGVSGELHFLSHISSVVAQKEEVTVGKSFFSELGKVVGNSDNSWFTERKIAEYRNKNLIFSKSFLNLYLSRSYAILTKNFSKSQNNETKK